MHTTECGSIRRVSRIIESTGSPELVDDRLSLEGHRRFGAHEMPSLLAEVDEIMAAAGCSPVHLVAVGGAPMLTRVPGRQTGDIDIVSEGLNDAVRDASRTVASRHNLTPAWINDGVKGWAVSVTVEPERIFTGKCLILDSAGPRYLLAMKLLSGREADEEDCIHLIRETGIYDEEELLDLIETAAGVRGLRPRDEYWAKEMLVRARKGRRMRSLRGWLFSRFRKKGSEVPSADRPVTRKLCTHVGERSHKRCIRSAGHKPPHRYR